MANANDLRRLALVLKGTTEAPHFDRAAFRVARIYVTLAPDGRTANFRFTPAEQEFKMAPNSRARLKWRGSPGSPCRRRQRICYSGCRPAEMFGAHSVKFLLLRGMPESDGNPGHSCVISEETGAPLGGMRTCH